MADKKPKEKANPRMEIAIDESELQELMEGGEFRWTFPTSDGVDVEVHLFSGTEDDVIDADDEEDDSF